jgi:hypothetical protein
MGGEMGTVWTGKGKNGCGREIFDIWAFQNEGKMVLGHKNRLKVKSYCGLI